MSSTGITIDCGDFVGGGPDPEKIGRNYAVVTGDEGDWGTIYFIGDCWREEFGHDAKPVDFEELLEEGWYWYAPPGAAEIAREVLAEALVDSEQRAEELHEAGLKLETSLGGRAS